MIREQLDTTLEALKQQRDEARLQLKLLGMEARDEWVEAEYMWELFLLSAKRAGEATGNQVTGAMAAFRKMADEMQAYYKQMHPKERVQSLLDDLRQKRDELRVQVHLLGVEARDELEEAEAAWERLTQGVARLGDQADDRFEDLADGVRKLRDDVADRFERLKKRIKD